MEGWETWRAGLCGETRSSCLPPTPRALGMKDTMAGVWEWDLAGTGLWRNESLCGQHDKGGIAVAAVGLQMDCRWLRQGDSAMGV